MKITKLNPRATVPKRARSLRIDDVDYRWILTSREVVVWRVDTRLKFSAPIPDVIGGDWYSFERARRKRSSDGSVTPGDVTDWIRSAERVRGLSPEELLREAVFQGAQLEGFRRSVVDERRRRAELDNLKYSIITRARSVVEAARVGDGVIPAIKLVEHDINDIAKRLRGLDPKDVW